MLWYDVIIRYIVKSICDLEWKENFNFMLLLRIQNEKTKCWKNCSLFTKK